MNTRKYGYCSEEIHRNFFFIFGCRPSKTVSADTDMVKQLVLTIENRYDKNTLKLEIPESFEYIKATNENLEITASSTIQPLNLFYEDNFVTETIGYIFVNTQSKGLPYRNAVKRGEHAATLLRDVLEFKTVETFTDLRKAQIIEKMKHLKEKADKLEEDDRAIKKKATEYFGKLDNDKTGELTKDEAWNYAKLMKKHTKKEFSKAQFEEEFEKLDFDNNRKISKKEIRAHGLDSRDTERHLTVAIIWIGHSLCPEDPENEDMIQHLMG